MEHVSVNTVDVVNPQDQRDRLPRPRRRHRPGGGPRSGIAIPTLCYLEGAERHRRLPDLRGGGEGAKNLVPACVYPIADGMEVYTNTERVQAARRTNLKLILSIHNQTCLTCSRSGLCELQRLCREYGVDNQMAFEGEKICYEPDTSAVHMVRDNPNASCAAGARLCAAWLRGWPASAHRAGASPPTSAPALTAR